MGIDDDFCVCVCGFCGDSIVGRVFFVIAFITSHDKNPPANYYCTNGIE